MARDGRHLVAQALAAARGHQHQGVVAAGDRLDDVLLFAAERAVAEDLLQDAVRDRGMLAPRRLAGSAATRTTSSAAAPAGRVAGRESKS